MKTGEETDRAARLAARLRDNLHRRKAQARSRGGAPAGDDPIPAPTLPKPRDGG